MTSSRTKLQKHSFGNRDAIPGAEVNGTLPCKHLRIRSDAMAMRKGWVCLLCNRVSTLYIQGRTDELIRTSARRELAYGLNTRTRAKASS